MFSFVIVKWSELRMGLSQIFLLVMYITFLFFRVLAVDVFNEEANKDEMVDLIFKEYSEFSVR